MLMEQAPIPGVQTCLPSLYIPPIFPPSCTVCDREIWVFVEFTKNFPKTFNTTKENVMPFEWIGTIPTKH